jgi:hypothetical protein
MFPAQVSHNPTPNPTPNPNLSSNSNPNPNVGGYMQVVLASQVIKDAAMAHRVSCLVAAAPPADRFLVVCGVGKLPLVVVCGVGKLPLVVVCGVGKLLPLVVSAMRTACYQVTRLPGYPVGGRRSRKHLGVYAHMHTCTYAHSIHINMCIHIYICMHICTCTYHTCIYICTCRPLGLLPRRPRTVTGRPAATGARHGPHLELTLTPTLT